MPNFLPIFYIIYFLDGVYRAVIRANVFKVMVEVIKCFFKISVTCCQSLDCVPFCSKEMLVQVEYQGVQKWVRFPLTDDCYDYLKFIQEGKFSGNSVVLAAAIK